MATSAQTADRLTNRSFFHYRLRSRIVPVGARQPACVRGSVYLPPDLDPDSDPRRVVSDPLTRTRMHDALSAIAERLVPLQCFQTGDMSSRMLYFISVRNLQLSALCSTVKSITTEMTIITTVRYQGNALADTFNANSVQCLAHVSRQKSAEKCL